MLKSIHHIAIICSDYEKSKHFYTEILGFQIMAEHFREERESYKLDLSLNGKYLIELFSFPSPPKRVSQPEASGLRHLAFSVDNIEAYCLQLHAFGIETEIIRIDPYTKRKFTFFADPDHLPIELVEIKESDE